MSWTYKKLITCTWLDSADDIKIPCQFLLWFMRVITPFLGFLYRKNWKKTIAYLPVFIKLRQLMFLPEEAISNDPLYTSFKLYIILSIYRCDFVDFERALGKWDLPNYHHNTDLSSFSDSLVRITVRYCFN